MHLMRVVRKVSLLIGLAVVLMACGQDEPAASSAVPPAATQSSEGVASTAEPASETSTPQPTPTPQPTATAAPTATVMPTATAVPTPTTPPTPTPVPTYEATVVEISDEIRDRIEPTSWRPSCPVGLADLRLITLRYWDYDGAVQTGELIVHADHAEAMAVAFGEIFEARFPIQSMELVDVHGGSDQASMKANNTSAFNCREVAYSPGVWSNHAFGLAIDINPLVNPYVSGDFVDPAEGAPYVVRDAAVPGLIVPGDPVTVAMAGIGWIWGGDWSGVKDYQHFSANGG